MKKVKYEKPKVIYETIITTRAGSPLSTGEDYNPAVDPANLFGENND